MTGRVRPWLAALRTDYRAARRIRDFAANRNAGRPSLRCIRGRGRARSQNETMTVATAPPVARPVALAAVGLAAWLTIYANLPAVADAVLAALPVARDTPFGEAAHFFVYEAPKVLLLLVLVVFVVGVVRSYFSPERTRALLARRGGAWSNVLAAGLGVVTPFCSCSAVPLFIGFLTAGVPLGVTFSFLVSAPMVNEVALALLFALFGWRIALLYLALGLATAIVSGLVLGRLRMEGHVEDWVAGLPRGQAAVREDRVALAARLGTGWAAVREIVGKVWPYVVAGIAVGAGIHGYVPENFMAGLMGRGAWWSVPAAVLLGVPMYSNAAGIIPIVEALLDKGAALGTVLAFMMSVIALSLPEMIILRKVLKPRLLATFVAVVAGGILVVGYVFNAIL
jgi:uncharacterized membrane protein YraQ (UPF0718 family)